MLNTKAKNKALRRHEKEVDTHKKKSELVRHEIVLLHELRHKTAASVVAACEKYLSDLANAPRELQKSVGELKTEFTSFEATAAELQEKADEIAISGRRGAAKGGAVGIGVAAFAPSVVKAIATNFGTASTGTAISTLSGAASKSAIHAWLGLGFAGAGKAVLGRLLLKSLPVAGWALAGRLLGLASYGQATFGETGTLRLRKRQLKRPAKFTSKSSSWNALTMRSATLSLLPGSTRAAFVSN